MPHAKLAIRTVALWSTKQNSPSISKNILRKTPQYVKLKETKQTTPVYASGRVVEYKPAGSNLFELVPTEDSTAGLTLDGYSVTTRAPPAADAPDIDHLAYVHYQLDTLDGREVLAGLVLQEGSSCRLQGGATLI